MRAIHLPLAALVAAASPLSAQCPTPAPAFGPGGAGGPVLDFVTTDLGDGPTLYAAGRFSTIGDVVAKGVARWNGQSWSALGAGIEIAGTERVSKLEPIHFGGARVCAVGSFQRAGDQPARGIATWDGQQWDTLEGGPVPPPGTSLVLADAAVFDEGAGPRLFAGGYTVDAEGNRDPFLARFDGAAWTSVANAPTVDPCDPQDYYCVRNGAVTSLVVWDDGAGRALYVGGDFHHVGGLNGFNLARYDGAAWSLPGGGGIGGASGAVWTMTLHDDGGGRALYLMGNFPSGPDPRIVRWNAVAFSALAPVSAAGASELVSLPACGGQPAGLWYLPTLPMQQDSNVHALRWNGAAWMPFDIPLDYFGDTFALGAFDSGNGNELFLGGDYHVAGNVTAASVARFDGAAWHAFSPGLGFTSDLNKPGYLGALAVHDDGTGPALYAGGQISFTGGTSVANLVRWNGSAWQPLAGLTLPYLSHIDGMLSADVGQGPSLYLRGDIKIGNNNPVGFARWNGAGFDATGLGSFTVYDMVVFDAGGGPELFVASGSSVLRFSGGGFTTVANAPSASLRALCVHDDGGGAALYVGGSFASFGGIASRGIVRWNGTLWSAVGGDVGLGTGEIVEELAVTRIGGTARLVAGGAFTVAGGTSVSNVAVWDGSAWSDAGGGVGGAGARVYALQDFDDGRGTGVALYAGGRFTSAGGLPARNLARFDGQAWSGAGLETAGSTPTVRALCTADLPALAGRTLSIGGDFESVGPVPSQRYARLSSCGQTGTLGCFGDGSAAACPCGNASAVGAQAGCLHSLGVGATVRAHGSASLSNDTLVLDGGSLPASSGLYFQGAGALAGGAGVAFGDGIRCLAGPYRRLGNKASPGGTSSYPDLVAGDLSVSVKGAILAPGTAHYQLWYRNAAVFCTSATFNYTNTVRIEWGP